MKLSKVQDYIIGKRKKRTRSLLLSSECNNQQIVRIEGNLLLGDNLGFEEGGFLKGLPVEILMKIFGFLAPQGKYVTCLQIKPRKCAARTHKVVKKLKNFLFDSLKIRLVCSFWKSLAEDDIIWTNYYMLRWPKSTIRSSAWEDYKNKSSALHQQVVNNQIENAKRIKALKKQEVTLKLVEVPIICANALFQSVFYADGKKTPTYVTSPCMYM